MVQKLRREAHARARMLQAAFPHHPRDGVRVGCPPLRLHALLLRRGQRQAIGKHHQVTPVMGDKFRTVFAGELQGFGGFRWTIAIRDGTGVFEHLFADLGFLLLRHVLKSLLRPRPIPFPPPRCERTIHHHSRRERTPGDVHADGVRLAVHQVAGRDEFHLIPLFLPRKHAKERPVPLIPCPQRRLVLRRHI